MKHRIIMGLACGFMCVPLLVACSHSASASMHTDASSSQSGSEGRQKLKQWSEDFAAGFNDFADKPVREHLDNLSDGVQAFGREASGLIESGIEKADESGLTDRFVQGIEKVGEGFQRLPEIIRQD